MSSTPFTAYPILPALPGTYILIFSLFQPLELPVGKGKPALFSPGEYAYFGSAFGPGGLRARLSRHLSLVKKDHWHIDRLLPRAVMRSIFYSTYPEHLECAWVKTFHDIPTFQAPAVGFGASDCRAKCPAHLLRLPAGIDLRPWFDSFRSPLPGKELSVWLRDI